ncbi:MAG: C25 family cysteine peptidase, partial [Bacteroidota bacterium]
MKKYFFILFWLATITNFFSQAFDYSNGWINYSQQYFKIKLHKEGIYRLDVPLLGNAGINTSTIDSRKFQIFINGSEQFIHVTDSNSNNILDGSDFIEFYGNMNDAAFDSSMYQQTSFLINPFLSNIQDTAAAFLTWNNNLNNKRFILQNDTSFSSYSPAQWFYSKVVNTGRSAGYFVGGYNVIGQVDSRYTACEGWINYGPALGTTQTINVFTPKLFTTGGPTKITATYLSTSANAQLLSNPLGDHHLKMAWRDKLNNTNVLRDTTFWGYKSFKDVVNINSAVLDDTLEFEYSNINHSVYTTNTFCASGYFSVFYPRTYDLSGLSSAVMYIPDALAPSNKTYASFSGFSSAIGSKIKAFDLTNGNIFYPTINGNSGQMLLPNGGLKKVLLTSDNNDILVNQIFKINGTGYFTDYLNQFNTDSSFVIVTNPKFLNEANDYKLFRQSIQGGNHNVVVANVEELYDHFALGIEKHPKAIRNFMKFLLDSSNISPRYLLLIGKSVPSSASILNQSYYQRNLVPSWGYPCSDNLLLAGLNGTFLEPAVPTGRLAATTTQEIKDYLDKVKMHDTATVAAWQKNAAHFIGGYTPNDLSLFTFYMNNYKQIIEDTLFGANVTTFTKNTSSPIQTTIPDSVINLINGGVSMVTFYGHSSNQSFDFDISDPGKFSNLGKYPLILSNSCYTGDIHLYDTVSLSEKFVFAKDKGSIAFIGSATTGVAQFLNVLSTNFYKSLSSNFYGKGIGDILKAAIIPTQNFVQTADEIEKITCMDMTLHGDPSIKLNPELKPDYEILNQDLNCQVTNFGDSIAVNLKIKNLSRAVKDSMRLIITRTYLDGSKDYLVDTIPAPYFIYNYHANIPVKTQKGGTGLNFFSAQIDDINEIEEVDNLQNNKTENIPLIINGDDIIPVYPYEFQVLPLVTNITLKASTVDPFAPQRNYVFQLDTSDNFLNPIASTTLTAMPGGLVEWNVNLLGTTPTDSVVYYWRVSRDSTGPINGFEWRESSFQLIDNKYGWGQSHFHQFKKNRLKFIDYLKPTRRWEFSNNKNSIAVKQGFYPFWGGSVLPVDLIFNYNSRLEHAASTAENGWSFFVIDTTTALFDTNTIQGTTYKYGTSNNCLCGKIVHFDFGTNNTLHSGFIQNTKSIGDSIASFLNDLPSDKWVLGYSNNFWRGVYNNANGGGPQFDTSFYSALDNFGVPGTAALINLPDTQAVV